MTFWNFAYPQSMNGNYSFNRALLSGGAIFAFESTLQPIAASIHQNVARTGGGGGGE